ncbi:MAG: BON domain-containing protein [Luteitalea sp.]|nr:BON domain-containing protein [Luteitalea sp.]
MRETFRTAYRGSRRSAGDRARLHRAADINARRIDLSMTGAMIRLTGTVGSWHERDAAERAASHAIGAVVIDSRIDVSPDDPFVDDMYEIPRRASSATGVG